ncbi:MAG: hypothetical protein EA366_12290 [Spirulina sp. DLM2.Bin59]|nr:MAG: hypothetical protein EA366_12290 [Spirulina sp. DLM2.Bin59]
MTYTTRPEALQRPSSKVVANPTTQVVCVHEWGGQPRQTIPCHRCPELVGLVVENANDWRSDQNGDGRCYPSQYRIVRDITPGATIFAPWILIDETGWDGHQECDDKVISRHPTYEAADAARAKCFA